jgi:hypothetical protein
VWGGLALSALTYGAIGFGEIIDIVLAHRCIENRLL